MNRALYIAKTGLDVQNMRMAVISHNLANANTSGYKVERAEFQDLMYQNIRQPGGQSDVDTTLPSGLQLGSGAKVSSTFRSHEQGNIIQTDNPLDMSINGDGFFQILKPDGNIAYTRDGSFKLNQNGDVVNSDGYPLEPNINVPNAVTKVSIGFNGVVQGTVPGEEGPVELGQIEIANFINPAGLETVGNNLYVETVASGAPVVTEPMQEGSGQVQQNTLESSNVNTVQELIGMVEAQRTYEMNSKAISAVNGMMQFLTNNV